MDNNETYETNEENLVQDLKKSLKDATNETRSILDDYNKQLKKQLKIRLYLMQPKKLWTLQKVILRILKG